MPRTSIPNSFLARTDRFSASSAGLTPLGRVLLLWGLALVGGCAVGGCAYPDPYVARPFPSERVATPEVAWRVYLVGELGGARRHVRSTLRALRSRAKTDADTSTIVVLGNSVEANFSEGGAYELGEQLEAFEGLQVIYLAGDMDWGHGDDGGWAKVRELDDRLAQWAQSARESSPEAAGHAVLLPPRGAPGPTVVDLPAGRLRIVAIDTQWWLHSEEKPREDPEVVMERLREALRTRGERRVLVVGHHPLESLGNSGGYSSLRQHLFPFTDAYPHFALPLPIIGTMYRWTTRWSRQALVHPRYQRMIASLEAAFSVTPPLVYAASHDRNLQVKRGAFVRYHLVSGAASTETSPVSHDDRTLFSSQHPGFIELECYVDGRIRMVVWQTERKGPTVDSRPIYSKFLDDPQVR